VDLPVRRCVALLVLLLALAGTADAAVIRGTAHSDGIAAQDGRRQTVACGRGRDVVSADRIDVVRGDCETVSRQLSRDTLVSGPAQHSTEVEPDSFASGRTIVSVFQVARIHAGAAMQIGWATSHDAGKTWRNGYLPGLTIFSVPAGVARAVSDPAVAYDAAHGTWLAATLAVSGSFSQLPVSRSPDGIRWSLPVQVAIAGSVGGAEEDLGFDKEWISCDNGVRSPFRGRCYLPYTDLAHNSFSIQYSSDGGLTWSSPVGAASEVADRVVGVQPASLPDGTLTILFVGEGRDAGMWSVRSRDGGVSYEAKVAVSRLAFAGSRVLREFPLPSAESVGGDVYAAWSDCRFRSSCSGNDLVFARTSDGVHWSEPQRVPLPQDRDYVIPGLGVDPGGRLALTYYTLPDGCASLACGLGVGFVTRGASAWSTPRRLNPQPIRLSWIAHTSSGRMVGDYISTEWAGGRPVAVFVLARAPALRAGRLRESVFAFRP
jgi:hypothetical protein